MKTPGHCHSLKCSAMKKLFIIGVLIFPLCVFSQGLLNDLRFSAFIGEGMGSGFGVETNRNKTIEYSLGLGYGELIYDIYDNMNIRSSSFFQHDNFYQTRMSIPIPDSLNGWYINEYSSVFHLSFLSSVKICDCKNIYLQFSIGSQLRMFMNNGERYYFLDSNIYVVHNANLADDKLINKKYHNVNLGFLAAAKVSFFNNKKFSPFLSYGGFVDVIDASKFRWLHVFQVGVAYNWHKAVD